MPGVAVGEAGCWAAARVPDPAGSGSCWTRTRGFPPGQVLRWHSRCRWQLPAGEVLWEEVAVVVSGCWAEAQVPDLSRAGRGHTVLFLGRRAAGGALAWWPGLGVGAGVAATVSAVRCGCGKLWCGGGRWWPVRHGSGSAGECVGVGFCFWSSSEAGGMATRGCLETGGCARCAVTTTGDEQRCEAGRGASWVIAFPRRVEVGAAVSRKATCVATMTVDEEKVDARLVQCFALQQVKSPKSELPLRLCGGQLW